MILGILPAVGSGLHTMARAGQLGRLAEYVRAWGTGFGHATYFSYLDWSVEEPHWYALMPSMNWDCHWTINASGGGWPWWRALVRPLRQAEDWRGVTILRAMNLLAAIPALTANLVWRTPFVVSLGADYEAIARIHGDTGQVWKWGFLQALVLRRAAAVIVPNPVQAARLHARHPRARIVHLPNWVDTERFAPKCRRLLELGTSALVLYVGRLVAEKNLLRAARAVDAAGGMLMCVGSGPETGALTAAGALVFSVINWESLPVAAYGIAGAFVLPSLSEGHPKSLLEAMACGLPCLVSDRVEGIVEHERTALVFGAEDEASMRAAVERLLREPALARRLGAVARAEAVARYAKGPILAREVALLKEVAQT